MRARLVTALRVALGIVGVAMLALLVREVGPDALVAALRRASGALPIVLALEGARIGADALATRFAYGSRAGRVPTGELLRAHLIGYAVSAVSPAGRATSEATKAALLARWVGGAAATAAAAVNQAAVLVATAIISVPCAIAAWRETGPSLLTWAIAGQAAALVVMAAGIRALTRARRLGGWIGRRFARIAPHAEAFQDASHEAPLLPPRPILAMTAGRVLQVVQYGILAHAAGVDLSIWSALLAQGVHMVVLALGVMVPAQVGVNEGAFALFANPLGLSSAAAVAIALLARMVQVAWVVVGSLTPFVWKARARDAVTAPNKPA